MKDVNLTLSTNDTLSLISNLSTMITAGIPIIETVDSLLEDAKGNTKKVLQALRDDLMQGKRLYSSFSRFPKVFNKVTINVIKASEEAGTLDICLKDLKTEIKNEMEFNDKIKGALIYPAVILLVFISVLLVILIVVMPKISMVFLRLKVALPLPTRILIFVSDLILKYTIPVTLVVIIICLGLFFLYKKKRNFILHLLYKLPVISQLVKEIDLTRFSRSMHLLLSSGVTITVALELTEDTVLRKDITQAIVQGQEAVLAGQNLSEEFRKRKNVFPGIMVKMIEAGEKTGTLDKSMQDVSEYLDYQVSKSLKTFITLLEPVMLIFVGILVGGMMLSIIAPIYGLIGQVGVK